MKNYNEKKCQMCKKEMKVRKGGVWLCATCDPFALEAMEARAK